MKLRHLAISCFTFTAIASAEWAIEPHVDVPIDTLLKNLEARVKKDPKDASLQYLLGRVHSLAFATEKKTVPVANGTEGINRIPRVDGYGTRYSILEPGAPWNEARRAHLRKTIAQYRIARRLDTKNPLYFMGLGWALEQATYDAKVLATSKLDNARSAVTAYREAMKLSVDKDMKSDIWGPDPFISIEAGQGILRLYDRKLGLSTSDRHSIEATLKKVKGVTRAVTPILVPLRGETSVGELLDPGRTTRFDLAGDGRSRTWPWVRPKTGVLVWDPRSEGKITSGCQLFGSATWWMFFRDGYQALASLDSDMDGWLSGRESAGIRMWIDADQDGVSDEGEVSDLASFEIEGIRTRASGTGPVGPFAKDGIRWRGGRVTPSFDWCPTSRG